MICYALGVCFNAKNITWFVPGALFNPNHLFADRTIHKWKHEMTVFGKELDVGICGGFAKDDSLFYAFKLREGYCIISCDSELSTSEMNWLAYHLLIKKISISDVAINLSKYIKDAKVETIRQDIGELKVIMKDNIEKIISRGGKIEDLLERTAHLPQVSFRFHKQAEQYNSCCII